MNQADEHEHAEGHNVPWLVNHFVSGRHMVLCLLQAPEFIRGAVDESPWTLVSDKEHQNVLR